MSRETERIDLTELFYLTITSLRKAKGSNNIEKQIADTGNTKTKQTRLLEPDQETTRPNNPPVL
jgi:hypothetical protein